MARHGVGKSCHCAPMANVSTDRVLAREGFTGRDREQFRRICDAVTPSQARLLIAAVLKNPKLLTLRPGTIAANAKASALVLGIDAVAFLRLAATQPSLFNLRPEGLQQKIAQGCAAFNIPRHAFVGMCLKRPSLLTMTTARIAAQAVEVARLLPTDVEPLTCAFLKRPGLLTLKPQTIAANVTTSAELLRLTVEDFIRCALAQPTLFYMKPESLRDNVARSTKALGVPVDAFMAATMRQPSLLYRSPGTLAVKGTLLEEMMAAVDFDGTLGDFITRHPAGLTYAPGHLKARLLLVRLGLTNAKAGRLLAIPTREVDALLVAYYRRTAASFEAGEHVIRALVESDIIKNPRAVRHKRQNSRRSTEPPKRDDFAPHFSSNPT